MSDFNSNKFRRVQDRCKACLELLGRYSESDVSEKFEVISDLYSYLGNATMQLGNLDLALEYHQMDLMIGDQLLVSFFLKSVNMPVFLIMFLYLSNSFICFSQRQKEHKVQSPWKHWACIHDEREI